MRALLLLATNLAFLVGAGSSSSSTVASCRLRFPELLARVDNELAPWQAAGVTRSMIESVWKCPESGAPRFIGLFVSIRNGKVGVHESRQGSSRWRAINVVKMLQSVAEVFDLPNVDFSMLTTDHPEQGRGPGRFPSERHKPFNPALAPLLLAYRKPRDSGTAAVPDWTWWGQEKDTSAMPSIDDAAAEIAASARARPWDQRLPRLFFMGLGGKHDERTKAWKLALEATPPGWIKIGLQHVSTSAVRKCSSPRASKGLFLPQLHGLRGAPGTSESEERL